jgi:Asp-tRNA(Asn)/Glu-tRNA(Gln) amidotransferase A subunit family amidase
LKELNRLSTVEAVQKLASREIPAIQYLKACLDHIDKRETDVRAFAFLNRDGALAPTIQQLWQNPCVHMSVRWSQFAAKLY